MKRSGVADLPLHNGHVPQWLAERMTKLGAAIAETVVWDYGASAFLSRLSDPFWFQALSAVMGMETTSPGSALSSEFLSPIHFAEPSARRSVIMILNKRDPNR